VGIAGAFLAIGALAGFAVSSLDFMMKLSGRSSDLVKQTLI